jgi:hypothetical protein
MKHMPSRDTSGNCKGECRDRVFEGEVERQQDMYKKRVGYSSPSENSPSWTSSRNEPPGSYGGRV